MQKDVWRATSTRKGSRAPWSGSVPSKNCFLKTLNISFLWFGTILFISTIAFLIFDCLPEVFAGVIGALVFIFCIFVILRKFYTHDRVAKARLRKGLCRSCGEKLAPGRAGSYFSSHPIAVSSRTASVPQGRRK